MTDRKKRTVHAAKSISTHRVQPVFVTNHKGNEAWDKPAGSLAGVAFLFLVIFSVFVDSIRCVGLVVSSMYRKMFSLFTADPF